MVVTASCCGYVCQRLGTERLVRIEGKINGANYRQILDENLLQSAQDLRLGQSFTFQQDNDPKHTAKTTQEEHLNISGDLKISVQRLSPTKLTELERICRETPQIQVSQAK